MNLYGFAVKSKPWEITHLAEKLDEDRYRDVISGHHFTPSKYPSMFIASKLDYTASSVDRDHAYGIRQGMTNALMARLALPVELEEGVLDI